MPLLDFVASIQAGGGGGTGESGNGASAGGIAAGAAGGAAASPTPEESAALSSYVAAATASLDEILSTTTEISAGTAQAVTSLVSNLLDTQASAGVTMDPATTEMLQSSVISLTRAASPGAGAVTLSSSNLNVTSEAFADAASLAAKPVTCPSSTGREVAVELPAALLNAGSDSGYDPSLPVATMLYVTSNALHSLAAVESEDGAEGGVGDEVGGGGGTSRRRTRRRLSTGKARVASPMVSFSIVQSGSELRIRGAASPINISVPVDVSASASSDGGEATRLGCRWWDSSGDGSWSSAGCETIVRGGAGGGVTCSCTHLSDFILWEFPMSVEECAPPSLWLTLPHD